jgi:hypothetical protein
MAAYIDAIRERQAIRPNVAGPIFAGPGTENNRDVINMNHF